MKLTIRNIGYLSFCTSFFFFVSLFAVHILKNDFNLLSRTYSDYVLGPYGWIVSTSLISVGISQLSLAAGYHKKYRKKILTGLLIIAGTGGLMTGLFPTTEAKNINLSRSLHLIGSVLEFGFLPLASVSLSRITLNNNLRKFFLVNGILTFLLFSFFGSLVLLGVDSRISYFGIIEKTTIFLLITGLLVMSSDQITSTQKKKEQD